MTEDQAASGLLRACSSLSSPWLATTVKAVKHLSTSPPLLDVLQNADAIAVLVKVLDENLARSGTNVSRRDVRVYAGG
jgi:hypothetical protein